MSEHEEGVPLTRRERRMRELAETGALNLAETTAQPAAPVVAPGDEDIEISPLNPDGTPRSRREIRVLREEALAAREAARTGAATEVTPATSETTPDESAEQGVIDEAVAAEETVVVEPFEVSELDAESDDVVPAVVEGAPESLPTGEDFDYIISPPTEPFTVEELRAAEAGSESAEAVAVEPELVLPQEPQSPQNEESEADAAGKSRLKFWKRNKSSETEATTIDGTAEATIEEDVATAQNVAAGDTATAILPQPILPETPSVTEDETEPETAEAETTPPVIVEPAVVEGTAAEPVVPVDQADSKDSYSFPDIAPPEEWRSVFDDPATLNVPAQSGEPQGDFDDLISRAVAQEGSATGTSALILPTMPEDTGGLTGPLGATGELYVTGSMRLPKSLGETGGHVSLHDSAEIDPITGAESVEDTGGVASPTPVSARHAVSARVVSGVPAVAKPTRERSKLPLVLGLTGGGLLVVVVGLGVWGATNGMFG